MTFLAPAKFRLRLRLLLLIQNMLFLHFLSLLLLTSVNFKSLKNQNTIKVKITLGSWLQCCGAGRSRGFLARTGADILSRLQLLFLASEKLNDLKMFIFHCIPVLYIFFGRPEPPEKVPPPHCRNTAYINHTLHTSCPISSGLRSILSKANFNL